MDILSHALWAGAAGLALRRAGRFGSRDVAGATALGAAPDLVALVPVSAWAAGQPDSWRLVYEYATATPGFEPALAAWVRALEHHVHCSAHSVLVAALATLLAWRFARKALPWTLGWWLHIAIDVPTHSSAYYPVQLLYPLSAWGVDGVAWITPQVLAANYAALAIVYAVLLASRPRPWCPDAPDHGRDGELPGLRPESNQRRRA